MDKNYGKLYTGWWIVGIIVVAIGLLWWSRHFASKQTNRELALSCTRDMATQFHIHPHLQILINKKQQEIPANIGVSLTCMHPIHTHDVSGKIHVESPELRDFTLADFFAVWGKTFNKNQIFESIVDSNHVIKMTLNGTPINTFENTIMHDNDQIVISYETER